MQDRSQIRWRSTLLLIGTIVGAGIFGVPAMIGAWGVPVSTIAFAAITLVVLAAHLLYAEALLANGKIDGRLEQHAAHWLGKPVGMLAGGIQTIQIFGSNLAYLILGGEFLAVLAQAVGVNIPVIIWQMLFWVLGAVIVCYGLAAVARIEAHLTWLLIVTIIILIIAFAIRIRIEDISLLGLSLPERVTFEPYGVILFSLLGITPIPEILESVGRRRDDAYKVIIRGTVVSAFLTYAFGVFGWLVSSGLIGRNPSDLVHFLPPVIALVFPLAGFLAIITSFLTTTLDLRNMFHLDYHFSNIASWVVSLGVPLVLLFLTPRDFLATIGLIGAVFSSAIAVIVSLMGYQALTASLKRRDPWQKRLWSRVVPIIVSIILILSGILWYTVSSPNL